MKRPAQKRALMKPIGLFTASHFGIGLSTVRELMSFTLFANVVFWLLPFLALAPQARANLITSGSFDSISPTLSTNGICTTDNAVYPSVDPGFYPACSASGWTGIYQIGNGATIGVYGVSFGIPQPDPDGASNALILQAELDVAPTATQSINIPTTGLYTLTFYVANRSEPTVDDGPQTVSVLLDGTAIAGGTYDDLPAAWNPRNSRFHRKCR